MHQAQLSCLPQLAKAAAAGNAALLMIAQGQRFANDEGKDITAEYELGVRQRVALAEQMIAAYA